MLNIRRGLRRPSALHLLMRPWQFSFLSKGLNTGDFTVRPVDTSNNVEATFDFVEPTFDFVATNGNNVERFYCKIPSFCQYRMLLRHYCRFWQQCRSNIRHSRKNRSTCSVRQCCFDNVASVNGALGLTRARYVEYSDEDADRPLREDICRDSARPGDLPVPAGNYSAPLRVWSSMSRAGNCVAFVPSSTRAS